MSPQLESETDEFLYNPPDVKCYSSFRLFFNKLAKCVLRAEVDKSFEFNTKTATTLTYMGTVLLLGIDRESKEGLGKSLESSYQELVQAGELALTPEQAMLVLKQQEAGNAMKLLVKFAQEAAATKVVVEATDVTPVETEAPVGRRIALLQNRAEQKQQKQIGEFEDDYAF